MKIALLTYSTRPRGGVVHTLALAEALAAAGEDVTIFTLGRSGDDAFFRPVHPVVDVQVIPFPDVAGEDVGGRVLRSIEVLRAALDPADLDTRGFDIVHAQDCISANAADGLPRSPALGRLPRSPALGRLPRSPALGRLPRSPALGRLPRSPALGRCVRTVHHLDSFTTPELAACHERAIVTPIAHVCVSHAVADELAAGWGITATVIPNGVDAARFEAAASDVGDAPDERARWRAELPPGPIVLAVGGIEPRKGTIDLVEAMAHLRRSVPDARLVIAGGETLFDYRDYRAGFDARCTELGVEPVVLGPVADDRLPALVASADVFAFPSTKEGFGLAAMEALAAGVPVVMRDLPVLREVFEGTARFAADAEGLGDGLVAALAPRSAGARETAAAGRKLARRHRWSDAAEAHRRLYRSVLAAATL